jgi:Domain of unknown function (DUF6980)
MISRRVTVKCECNQYPNFETPCCDALKRNLNDCGVHLVYHPRKRIYGIKIVGTPTSYVQMNYCYLCGKKFPFDLNDEWERILREEYNIDDPYNDKEQIKRIPAEFQTEEWWKKRGL